MSEPRMHVPQRWWWVVAVVVPLAGGAGAVARELIELFQDKGTAAPISGRVVIGESSIEGSTIVGGDLHEGDEVRTQIALTFGSAAPNLSPEERDILERALDRLKLGDYEGAIPVLQAFAEKTPTPSLLNNLAAAHLAVGEAAAARQAIEKARTLEGESELDVEAALNWNERRLARGRTHGLKPITGAHASQWDGIEVFLARVEDTGGMVTVEAIYRNATSEDVVFCTRPDAAYVIDERANKRWNSSFSSSVNCNIRLHPGVSLPLWVKFAFDTAESARITVVLPGVLPFEGLVPKPGDRD